MGRSATVRAVEAIGSSPVSDRVAHVQATLYEPLIRWARSSPLHSAALGHSLHPALTDVTLGCWLSTTVLDLLGDPESENRAAVLLTAVGVAAAVPTALAGAADWAEIADKESHRIGAVHALGADAALLLFIGSLAARLCGSHERGARLALAGNAVMAASGFLGGHLALARGTARRR